MPYSSVDDLPESVKNRLKNSKKRRQWMNVWNSTFERTKSEERAFAAANGVVKKAASPVEGEAGFSFFMPICKVDKNLRTVSGYASTEHLDLDGERVSREAIKAALPGYWEYRNIREMHQPSAVGVAKEANIDDKGLFLSAKIVDDSAWKKVEEGVYNGFSIGGRKLAKTGNMITKIDLIEVSVVDRPANPECKFTVQKSAKVDGAEAFLLPAPVEDADDASRAALSKMAEVVEFLAAPSAVKRATDVETQEAEVSRGERKRLKKEAKKAAKAEKKAEKLAKQAQMKTSESKSAPEPSFLTLDADGGAEAALGKIGSGHELDLEVGSSDLQKDGRRGQHESKLSKRMSAAGSLAYAFDSLRSTQRSLLREGKLEGGDRKDAELARQLGPIARDLASVISQKAIHEGEEALDLTDADDKEFLSIYGEGSLAMSATTLTNEPDALSKSIMDFLQKSASTASAAGGANNGPSATALLKTASDLLKQARKERDGLEECVKALYDAHRSAFLDREKLVKAGKKDKDDDAGFDHEKAMKVLKSVYSGLGRQRELTKSARDSLKKAAGRISGEGVVERGVSGVYEVPNGVKTISPGEMDNLSAAKGAKAVDMVSRTEAEALAKAAAAEAKLETISRLPTGGQKPYVFDTQKIGFTPGGVGANPVAEFFKGANPANLTSDNEKVREEEIAKAIGDRILGGAGKSLFDPSFRGSGGIGPGRAA